MPKFDKNDENKTARAKSGFARMREIADELRSEIAVVAAIMIEGAEQRLGRSVTPHEKLVAEGIASCHLKAARYRDQGKSELELEYLRMALSLESQSIYRQPGDTLPRHHEAGPSGGPNHD
jgi:hypothetical protein